MTVWSGRPPIVAAMLNPALIAAVVAAAANGHLKESDRPLPWPFAFVVVPLVLHRGTRQALPTTTRTYLSTWVFRHPAIRAGFPARARELVEPVREGLRFGLAHGALAVEGDALRGTTRRPGGFRIPTDLADLLQRGNLVGRWLAKSDDVATVFAVLGVRP